MDIIKTLTQIKGKVLDAAHFEILRNAYDLQNQNIDQLKTNNTAFRESNSLLKENNSRLEKETRSLKETVSTLEKQIGSFKSGSLAQEITEYAEAILHKCVKDDITEFNDERMIDSLPYSRIQAKVGLDELLNLSFICFSSATKRVRGVTYRLTDTGKKFALKLVPKENSSVSI